MSTSSLRALAVLALLSSAAHAGGRAADVGVIAGAGTPLGVTGVELSTTITRWLAIAGGVGVGTGGMAIAVQPRLFQRPDRSGMYTGTGLSLSQEQCRDDVPSSLCLGPDEHGLARWANIELGYQHRTDHGFVRGYVGYSAMLTAPDDVCAPGRACREQMPNVGLAIGTDLGTP
jgi:hypothetical protein